MQFKRKLLAVAIGGIAGALPVQVASAQETTAAPATQGTPATQTRSGPVIEEVIITAQKFEESLQKVPLSVTAMSGETLQNMGVANTADLLNLTLPGVQMSPFAGRKDVLNITMRGVKTDDPIQGTTDPGVAIIVDDVYNARGAGVGLNVAEIERMEVLRGPQGTLFGRNAVGGAIRIVTKEPTGALGGNAKIGFGNYGHNSQELHLNLPEFGGLSLKIDAKREERDGFVKNKSTSSNLSKQEDFGTLDSEGFMISALFKPTTDFTVRYAYAEGEIAQTNMYALHGKPCDGCTGAALQAAAPGYNVGEYPKETWIGMFNGPAITETTVHRLGLEWNINDRLTFKSITSYSEVDAATEDVTLNGAYLIQSFGGFSNIMIGRPFVAAKGYKGIAAGGFTGADPFYGAAGFVPFAHVTSEAWSQEFQLLGETDETKWVAGLYWFNEKTVDVRESRFSIVYTGFSGGRPANPVPVDPFTIGNATPNVTESEVKAWAAFGQLTWTPGWNPNLHLTGGLRYSDDKRTYHRSVNNGAPADIDQPPFDNSRVDGTFSVAYDLSEDTNVYARYATAYRAGGASVRAPWVGPLSVFATFQEEEVESLEAGFKTYLLDRRVRLNAAIYISDLKNTLQSVQLEPNVNPSTTGTVNLPGTTRVRGLELEAAFAATDQLTLSGNVTWQDYSFGQGIYDYIDENDVGANYAIPFFPRWNFSIAADYVMPTSLGKLILHADWNKSDKTRSTARVTPGGFNVLTWVDTANARATLRNIGATPFSVTLYVKNIFDETPPSFAATTNQWNPADPRTYGLEISADF